MAQLRIMAASLIQRSHISHHRVTSELMRSHFLWMVKAYTEAASQAFAFPWALNSGKRARRTRDAVALAP
jgi:hypothetical protein